MPEFDTKKKLDLNCQTIKCPICDMQNERVLIDKVNEIYRLVKCKNCGLVYTNPMPINDLDDARKVYDDWDYHSKFISDLDGTLRLARSEFKRQYKLLLNRKVIPHKGNLLDIGCGIGHILAAAKEMGWCAFGLEIDEKCYSVTKAAWDLDIRPLFLKDAGFQKNYFHWIRARYVLEHIPDPNEMLSEIYEYLAPGGIVMIDVPNQEGFASQRRIRKGIKQGMGQIYGYLDPPIHVIGYSPRTMKLLLERHKFEVPLSFSSFPGSPTWRPECAPKGKTRLPYMFIQWLLSLIGKGSISVTCGRKPIK